MEAKDRTDSRLKTYIHNSINSISPNIDSVFFPILEEIILRSGVEIKDVAEILGHKNIETTENYYISSDSDSRKAANDLFDKIASTDTIYKIANYRFDNK